MTFYQKLQLNQAGSKALVRDSETTKERWQHIWIYLLKITLTMAFCVGFVTVYSILFGGDNSIVGVAVLLCVMVFKNADFGIHTRESILLLAGFFLILAFAPHGAHLTGPVGGMLINMAALLAMMVLGCHNPFMFNHSTLVLGYLLLYGYDVSGESYRMRLAGIALGAVLTCIVFYRNHRKRTYEHGIKDVIKEFNLKTNRTRWQLCEVICVPLVLFLAEMFKMPRAMWAGIAAMSVTLPFMDDMKARVKGRIIGNVGGAVCFLLLYFLLPPSVYAYIGIIGGIGVGFSVKYGWQAVFNTFGALAIAAEAYGLTHAIGLRVGLNLFGAVFALMFSILFRKLLGKSEEEEAESPA